MISCPIIQTKKNVDDIVTCPIINNNNKTTSDKISIKSKPKPYYVNSNNIINGVKWYPKLVKTNNNKGLMNHYSLDELLSHLVVALVKQNYKNELNYLYTLFDSYIEFYNYQSKFKYEKCFFEVVNFYQKPHFDIDMDMDTIKMNYFDDVIVSNEELYNIANILIETIIKGCKLIMEPNILNLETDVLLYTSHDSKKLSFHIIIDNWCHYDNLEAKAFYDKVYQFTEAKLNGRYVEFMDSSVYTTNQLFRMLGSKKNNTNRIKIHQPNFIYNYEIINHKTIIQDNTEKQNLYELSKSLITFVSGCTLLQTFYIAPLYKFNNCNYVLKDDDLTDIKTLLYDKFGSTFIFREIINNIIYLKRTKPSYCPLCIRKHFHENPLLIIDKNRNVKWSCRRTDKKKVLILGQLKNAIEMTIVDNIEEDETDYNLLSMGGYDIDLTKPFNPENIELQNNQHIQKNDNIIKSQNDNIIKSQNDNIIKSQNIQQNDNAISTLEKLHKLRQNQISIQKQPLSFNKISDTINWG
jgi:hypothetical protein